MNNSAIRSKICGLGIDLPERIVSNAEIGDRIGVESGWIFEITGIKERRIADVGVPSSYFGTNAAKNALKMAGWQTTEPDLIIAATVSPDYYFPGIGTRIQNQLQCKFIPAIDIRAQCSGFVYGLSIADAFIKSGKANKILLIGADVQSPALDLSFRGKDTAVIFGDGAGAVAIEASSTQLSSEKQLLESPGIIDSILGSDGSQIEALFLRAPGSATPGFISKEDIYAGHQHPVMNGRVIFKHAVLRMTEIIRNLLEKYHLSIEDIDLIVPHQANYRINEFLRKKLRVDESKFFSNIHKYGNTNSATIPICLLEASQSGVLKPGMLIITVAFGAGLTWGANLIRWA